MLQASSQAEMRFLTPDKGGRGPQRGKLPILATFLQGARWFWVRFLCVCLAGGTLDPFREMLSATKYLL